MNEKENEGKVQETDVQEVEVEIVDGNEGDFLKDDYNKNKFFYAFAYLLFFLPLIFVKNSRLKKFYANQGLIVLFSGMILCVVNQIFFAIPYFGLFLTIATSLLVLCGIIYGMVNVFAKKIRKLPFIGHINIIKE